MILITKTPTGLLLMREELTIALDTAAIPSALGVIIGELIDSGNAIGRARLSGYEAGLIVGRANGVIEEQTRQRKEAQDAVDAVAQMLSTHAPLAA